MRCGRCLFKGRILLGIGLNVLVTVVWNYRKLDSVSIRQSHLPVLVLVLDRKQI